MALDSFKKLNFYTHELIDSYYLDEIKTLRFLFLTIIAETTAIKKFPITKRTINFFYKIHNTY